MSAACSRHTAAMARMSVRTPRTCSATFGQSGQSQRYSVTVSSLLSLSRGRSVTDGIRVPVVLVLLRWSLLQPHQLYDRSAFTTAFGIRRWEAAGKQRKGGNQEGIVRVSQPGHPFPALFVLFLPSSPKFFKTCSSGTGPLREGARPYRISRTGLPAVPPRSSSSAAVVAVAIAIPIAIPVVHLESGDHEQRSPVGGRVHVTVLQVHERRFPRSQPDEPGRLRRRVAQRREADAAVRLHVVVAA